MQYQSGKNRHLPQILAILTGSLLGLNNGMMFAWTSPSIPKLISDDTMQITFEEASYFTVLPPIAMLLTAPLFPVLANRLGRKWSLVLNAVPHILAWIMTALAYDVWTFYAARSMAGIADAAAFGTFPLYIGEISEPLVRGSWGNMFSISMYVGKFIVNTVGVYESIQNTAYICGCIPVLFAVLSIFLPESPYYLLKKGRENDAKEALKKLRWRNDVEQELELLKADVKRQISETGTMKDLFTIKSNRKALITCIGLRLAQMYSGLVAFETYTQYMFEEAGGIFSAKTSTIIFSGSFIPCIILSTFLIDKFGRRPLMIFSSLGCAVILTIEAIYFCLRQFTEIDLINLNWLPLGGMVAYIILCSTGLGFLPTLMWSEVLSTSIKGKASTIIILNQAFNALIIPKMFQILTYNCGIYAPFLLFSACTYTSALFSFLYLVETKGKTLEEVQQDLKGHKR